ncbi:MAG TPA: serine hydrolase, partial [Gemmatimonadaceae bacterium]
GRGQEATTPLQNCVSRVRQPLGAYKTTASADGQVMSNVDELYRLALGLENPRTYSRDTARVEPGQPPRPVDYARGWQADTFKGASRFSAFGVAGGKRTAFVRIPDRQATIIVLTNDDSFDAKGAADKIAERLFR